MLVVVEVVVAVVVVVIEGVEVVVPLTVVDDVVSVGQQSS